MNPININNQEDFDHAINSGLYHYLNFKSGRYLIRQTIDISNCTWYCASGDLEFIYLQEFGFMFRSTSSVLIGGTQQDKLDLYQTQFTTIGEKIRLRLKCVCTVKLYTFYDLEPLQCTYNISHAEIVRIISKDKPSVRDILSVEN